MCVHAAPNDNYGLVIALWKIHDRWISINFIPNWADLVVSKHYEYNM